MSLGATVAFLFALAGDPSRVVTCTDNPASCTMQDWMKGTVRPHLENEDYGKLALALRRLSNGAPAEHWKWREIARLAAVAAEHKDPEGVKAQCKACHDLYRKPQGKPVGPNAY